MKRVKPGQGPSCNITLQNVNFGFFLGFSDAIENMFNPFFTYYSNIIQILNAIRSPSSLRLRWEEATAFRPGYK